MTQQYRSNQHTVPTEVSHTATHCSAQLHKVMTSIFRYTLAAYMHSASTFLMQLACDKVVQRWRNTSITVPAQTSHTAIHYPVPWHQDMRNTSCNTHAAHTHNACTFAMQLACEKGAQRWYNSTVAIKTPYQQKHHTQQHIVQRNCIKLWPAFFAIPLLHTFTVQVHSQCSSLVTKLFKDDGTLP